ncbi:MAG: hypothetical protein H6821_14975 [Planctomycetaceae bacterium]|nr:hypothetical protein [Planctomycetales bacterium]MCB9875474.1 hypothetical protein [Planctomycetaceae bacterium]MCB9940072.1 hypothetical protein [Planctomycetaceae bacterium]HRX77833.1 hypothetical protein [Pirellulaceae bacterium]
MNRTFRFGVMLASLVFCFGCDSGPPPSTEAETKAMNESAEYEKQMMGEMSGTDTTQTSE